jgi:hypothetical protein
MTAAGRGDGRGGRFSGGRPGVSPAGWPPGVPPPDAPGWVRGAVGFLLDHCPPEVRQYAVVTRHPVVLATVAARYATGQQSSAVALLRDARADLGDLVDPPTIAAVLEACEREVRRTRQLVRQVELVAAALQGRRFAPEL